MAAIIAETGPAASIASARIASARIASARQRHVKTLTAIGKPASKIMPTSAFLWRLLCLVIKPP